MVVYCIFSLHNISQIQKRFLPPPNLGGTFLWPISLIDRILPNIQYFFTTRNKCLKLLDMLAECYLQIMPNGLS